MGSALNKNIIYLSFCMLAMQTHVSMLSDSFQFPVSTKALTIRFGCLLYQIAIYSYSSNHSCNSNTNFKILQTVCHFPSECKSLASKWICHLVMPFNLMIIFVIQWPRTKCTHEPTNLTDRHMNLMHVAYT